LPGRFSRAIHSEDQPAISLSIPQSGILLFRRKAACQHIFQKELPQGFDRFGGQRGSKAAAGKLARPNRAMKAEAKGCTPS
jgi:hypothetical protein